MRRAARLPLLVAGALVPAIAACGNDRPSPPTGTSTSTPATAARSAKPRRPAICAGRLRATVTGAVAAPEATELSGLVASRRRAGVLWTHNDSGDRPRLFALASDGRV